MCEVLMSMYCRHKGGRHLPFHQAAVSFVWTFTHLEQPATHRETCNSCRKFTSVSFHSLCWSITDASTPCAGIPVSSHNFTEDLLSASVTLFATSSVKGMGEEQSALIAEAQKKRVPLCLGGDGRADSPGHSAKYGSYSIIDLDHAEKL